MERPIFNLKTMFSSDEVSLKEILNFFWRRKWYVVIGFSIFGIIGYIGSSTMPLDYEAKCVLLTDGVGGGTGGGTGGGALAGLAGLAGINTGGGGDAGGGNDLYPAILASQPFLLELAKDTIYLSDDPSSRTTLAKYFVNGEKQDALTRMKAYIFSLPSHIKDIPKTVKGWFSSKKPASNNTIEEPKIHDYGVSLSNSATVIELNGQEMMVAGILKKRIKLAQNGNQITLSVLMPEARLSAEATKLVLNKLIKYVTKFKTSKQLETVEFLEARTTEASGSYRKNQQTVAGFKDRNYGVIYQSVQSEQERLQNEFVLSSTIYNQLASQLEQARIQLKKDTPLFTVLEPVYVPVGPNIASSFKLILSYALFGAFLGFALIAIQLVRMFYSKR